MSTDYGKCFLCGGTVTTNHTNPDFEDVQFGDNYICQECLRKIRGEEE